MTQKSIERFLEYASMKMPEIVKPANEQTSLREVYDDYTIMVFHIPQPFSIGKLLSEIEDIHGLTLMYHHMRSRQTDFGHSVCLYQEPGTGLMFQLDGSTDGCGKIDHIEVKLYSSMERMVSELRGQLRRMINAPGEFAYKILEEELLSSFL